MNDEETKKEGGKTLIELMGIYTGITILVLIAISLAAYLVLRAIF